MKRYYGATNSYASATSVGFANTWIVYAFRSRAERDEWVSNATDRATRAITRREIPKYLSGGHNSFPAYRGCAYRVDPVYPNGVQRVVISADTDLERL